jgi:hypothetical protein
VAHSLGTITPASAAARISEVPAGTVTAWPSMSSVTVSPAPTFGVPKSISPCAFMRASLPSKSARSADNTGIGVMLPMAHSEPCSHRVAEVFAEVLISSALSAADAIDDLDTARRADAAGRAFSAGFNGAEFHCITRLLRHVHGIVESDDTAVAESGPDRGKCLVVEHAYRTAIQAGKRPAARRPARHVAAGPSVSRRRSRGAARAA